MLKASLSEPLGRLGTGEPLRPSIAAGAALACLLLAACSQLQLRPYGGETTADGATPTARYAARCRKCEVTYRLPREMRTDTVWGRWTRSFDARGLDALTLTACKVERDTDILTQIYLRGALVAEKEIDTTATVNDCVSVYAATEPVR